MNILRSVIELSNQLLGRLKSGRQTDVPSGMDKVKINLGCGLAVTRGWVNIDGSLNALVASLPGFMHRFTYRFTGARQYYSEDDYCRLLKEHIFIHHDLATGIPLKDEVADFIYTSHFIEHLYLRDALNLLNECNRVLKPGGIMRLSVPDLEYAVSLYRTGQKNEMLKNYFFVEHDGNHHSQHKYMYDYEMLFSLLTQAGFRDIARCSYRKGRVPDSDVLDNRQDESLYIEALK